MNDDDLGRAGQQEVESASQPPPKRHQDQALQGQQGFPQLEHHQCAAWDLWFEGCKIFRLSKLSVFKIALTQAFAIFLGCFTATTRCSKNPSCRGINVEALA